MIADCATSWSRDDRIHCTYHPLCNRDTSISLAMARRESAFRRGSAGDGGRRKSSVIGDEDHLARLGVKQELKRNFSPLAMLGLAFAILNSWTALSASLSLALPSGGSTSVLWGLITAGMPRLRVEPCQCLRASANRLTICLGICNLCLAASLAEFLSAYPTAGGQYHW